RQDFVFKFLDQNSDRIFEQPFERFQERRSYCAIHCTVVAAHGNLHDVTRNKLTVADNGSFLNSADSKDTRIRRVDNSRELLNSEHTEVGNRKGTTLPVCRLQL